MKKFIYPLVVLFLFILIPKDINAASVESSGIPTTHNFEPIEKIISPIAFRQVMATSLSLESPSVEILEKLDNQNYLAGEFVYKNYENFDQMEWYFDTSKAREVKTVIYTSFRNDFTEVITEKEFTSKRYGGNHKYDYFTGIGLSCNAEYTVQIYDSTDTLVTFLKLKISNLANPSCNSELSGDYVGTDEDPSGNVCIVCECLESIGEKIDAISSLIPPAPNWNEVATTFKDTIIPPLMNDLKNYIGTVGTPPPTPPPMEELNDHNIMERLPEFQEVPELESSGFTSDDIKEQAPIIEEKPDNSGGFDLSQNPLETLPEVPQTIIPNQTENKSWMNTPNEPTNDFPAPPKQTNDNEIDLNKPPIPSENNSNENIPPTPSGTTNQDTNLLDYKPTPESSNGSGGEINN